MDRRVENFIRQLNSYVEKADRVRGDVGAQLKGDSSYHVYYAIELVNPVAKGAVANDLLHMIGKDDWDLEELAEVITDMAIDNCAHGGSSSNPLSNIYEEAKRQAWAKIAKDIRQRAKSETLRSN